MKNSFWLDRIRERQALERAESGKQILRSTDWGDESKKPLSEIIFSCVGSGIGTKRFKADTHKDVDVFACVEQAIIFYGLDSEDAPTFLDQGNQFELTW